MNSFYAWIGNTDIRYYQNAALQHLDSKENAPVNIALNKIPFEKIVLFLTGEHHATLPLLKSCLPSYTEFIFADLSSPVNYREIYLTCSSYLKEHFTLQETAYFLLSSGTPAMAAVWLLLGKTRYPGRFLQTYQNECREIDIPFQLTIDLIPSILQDQDQKAQGLPYVIPKEFQKICGNAELIQKCIRTASKAALHNVSVLLTGESGTGKELFAHAIHHASPRKNRPFEAINCAALPPALLEAELFGYEKGAFTGAHHAHAGAFRRVDGGTLFLDEIGECPPDLQVKLLRALQPPEGKGFSVREFYPVGADKPQISDVRLICATNRNLLKEIQGGNFRSDLYYRIATVCIHLPPLRQRREDLLLLAETLRKNALQQLQKEDPSFPDKIFSEKTKNFIEGYSWPGNIRQLYHAILQAIILCEDNCIEVDDLGIATEKLQRPLFEEKELDGSFSLDCELKEIQRFYLEKAYSASHGNKSKAAKLLGFSSYQRFDYFWRKK